MNTTNFDLRITKEQAEEILKKNLHEKNRFAVMCAEYGDDEDWVGMEADDLDEDGKLDDDYQTFELWFEK